MFGTQVGINFKGRSTVTSKLGAIFTLLTVGLGITNLYSLLIKLYNKEDPKINYYSRGMSLLENPTIYNLSESKFSLGFAIIDWSSGLFIDLRDFDGLIEAKTRVGSIVNF